MANSKQRPFRFDSALTSLAFFAAVICAAPSGVLAQTGTEFKVGDRIEIMDGSVVYTILEIVDDSTLLVDLEMGSQSIVQRKVSRSQLETQIKFEADRLKHMAESEAKLNQRMQARNNRRAPVQETQREWSDESGKFTIQASLVEQNDSIVRLRKSDGRIVDVPVEKLSKADLDYLASLTAESNADNPFAGGVMESASPFAGGKKPALDAPVFESINLTATKRLILSDTAWNVKPDVRQKPEDLQNSRGFALANSQFEHPFHNRYTSPAMDSAGSTCAVAVSNPFDRNVADIQVIDVASGLVETMRIASGEVESLDISPNGKTLVIVEKDRSKKHVSFFQIEDKKLTRIKGWDFPRLKSAVLLDNDTLLTVDDLASVSLIDWQAGTVALSIPVARGGSPTLSANNRLLAAHVNDRVVVVDLQEVDVVGSVTFAGGGGQVCFSDDGQHLAAMNTSGHCEVWQVSDGSSISQFSLSNLVVSTPIQWVGDRYLLVSGTKLVDINLQTFVWEYTGATPFKSRSGNYWYVSSESRDGNNAVLPMPMPHNGLDEATSRFTREELEVLKPGMSFALDLKLPFSDAENERIEKAIRKQLQGKGFTIDDKAEMIVKATSVHGKKDTIVYGDMIPIPSIFRREREQEISFTPVSCSIVIEHNGEKLWSTHRTYTAPHVIMDRNDNKSLEQIVIDACKPQPSFFETAPFPRRLCRFPNGKETLGTSTLTSSGVR